MGWNIKYSDIRIRMGYMYQSEWCGHCITIDIENWKKLREEWIDDGDDVDLYKG